MVPGLFYALCRRFINLRRLRFGEQRGIWHLASGASCLSCPACCKESIDSAFSSEPPACMIAA